MKKNYGARKPYKTNAIVHLIRFPNAAEKNYSESEKTHFITFIHQRRWNSLGNGKSFHTELDDSTQSKVFMNKRICSDE